MKQFGFILRARLGRNNLHFFLYSSHNNFKRDCFQTYNEGTRTHTKARSSFTQDFNRFNPGIRHEIGCRAWTMITR